MFEIFMRMRLDIDPGHISTLLFALVSDIVAVTIMNYILYWLASRFKNFETLFGWIRAFVL